MDDVSFACRPGTITGFLGPNGAGKTTTLRMITGLARPDAGQATVAGRPFTELPSPARVAGILLDASAMHAGRTGRATLRIAATMTGMPAGRVEEVLAAVGLTGAARRRVGTYSLGMRQRLGLAQALIGDPGVLILDEPATGLDPQGIAWIRSFLRDFADRGGTVLLSSHLLAEVQATADHLVVISAGRIVAAGALADLLAASGLIVRAADQAALTRLLTAGSIPFTPGPGGALRADTRTRRQPGPHRRARHGGRAAADRAPPGRRRRPGRTVPVPDRPRPRRRAARPEGDPMTTPVTARTEGRPTTSPVAARPAPTAQFSAIPFGRLLRAEWRKATGTRAARWLLAAVALTTIGGLEIPLLFPHDVTQTRASYLAWAGLGPDPAAADRADARDDRRMEPAHRDDHLHPGAPAGRVLAAKVATGMGISLAGAVYAFGVTELAVAGARAAGRHIAVGWNWPQLAGFAVFVLLTSAIGIAFGALLHNTAVAIVTYFVLGGAFSLLMIPALQATGNWVNTGQTYGWVLYGQWAGHGAQIAATTLLWVVLPLAAGIARTRRREVR